MASKFQIGDRVQIVVPPSGEAQWGEYHGAETSIVGICGDHTDCYVLDIALPTGGQLKAEGKFLKRIYDGNELVAWSDCVWQPAKLGV
jgi:ribosomal protein L21E